MNIFNDDSNFVYLLNNMGQKVIINDIEVQALISNQKDRTIDYKKIKTIVAYRTGDIVIFQGSKWIIISEVVKTNTIYKAIMRKCNNILRYKAVIDGVEGAISIPAIIDKGTLSIEEGKYFNIVDNELSCQVGYSMINKIKHIKVGFKFVLNGTVWSVLGIDDVSSIIFDEQGIIYIKLQSTLSSQEDHLELGLPHNETTPVITTSIGDDFTIELPTYIISIEQSKKFQIVAVCRNNNMIVTSPTLNYNVTDNTICKVDATGLVTGIKEGATTIIINYMGEEVTLNVTIIIAIVVPIVNTTQIVAVQGSNVNYINLGSLKSYHVVDDKRVKVVGKTFTWRLEQSPKNVLITPTSLITKLEVISPISYRLTANDNIKGYFDLISKCNEDNTEIRISLRVKGTMDS